MLGLVLCAALLASRAAALPDENEALRQENAQLRAELTRLRQQHAEEAPLPRPPAKQNLKGSKPNIFILFGDDIGHGDLNIFGHPTSTTPWLDKMASEYAQRLFFRSFCHVPHAALRTEAPSSPCTSRRRTSARRAAPRS